MEHKTENSWFVCSYPITSKYKLWGQVFVPSYIDTNIQKETQFWIIQIIISSEYFTNFYELVIDQNDFFVLTFQSLTMHHVQIYN